MAIPRSTRTTALACLVLAVATGGLLTQGEPAGHAATRVTSWARPGTKPLSDASAARLVSPAGETVPSNAEPNRYVPTRAQLAAFRAARTSEGQTMVRFNPLTRYVTGRPTGLSSPSTDELIQWVSRKWGIPTDLIRAQLIVESGWRQNFRGDRETVPSHLYSRYPRLARIRGGSDVYQSLGIAQVKWTADGAIGAGTEPLRWRSTAFNLDYYAAVVRYYYDGACSWCRPRYRAGQSWNSVGGWYSPNPWRNGLARRYIREVQKTLRDRTWTKLGR